MRLTQIALLSFKRCPVVVYKSTSTNVFENMALEDHIYLNKPPDQRILLLWRNQPCIVIGRHQNTWLEVNLKGARERNIPVCRRHSGGGTVYHDLGNLNFTFFTHKDRYKRNENLDFIIKVFRNEFNVELARNKKDDLVLDNQFKVSGTAAKLGLNNAYHHCTLLCQSDLHNLHELLYNPFGGFNTNATRSISSQTKNIFLQSADISFDQICDKIGAEYFNAYNMKGCRVHDINPGDCTDIKTKIEDLKSYEWTYAKSPKFVYESHFYSRDQRRIEFKIDVSKGIITNSQITCSEPSIRKDIENYLHSLIEVKFYKTSIENALFSKMNYEIRHKYFNNFIHSLPM